MTKRSRLLAITQRVYFEVETALWAFLAAFVIWFCVLIAPDLPRNLAKAQAERALEIADENRRYCEKWGKDVGTQDYSSCILDLQELRQSIEKRIADAAMF